MSTVLINEIEPNPFGSDPANVMVEILGTPGSSFSGFLYSIEADFGLPQSVDRKAAISGTFDVNGLLSVSIPDLENPSFTLVLSDATATANVGDTYTGANASIFGNVLDAIGMPDSTADEAFVQGAALGGADFAYTGDEPKLIFRDGVSRAWFAVNDPDFGEVIDIDGNSVDPSLFDVSPLVGTTFGAPNPTQGTGGIAIINEIEPNPFGSDPATVSVEIKGVAGTSFSGFLYSIEADFGLPQSVDRKAAISGTFDGNGLLTVSIPDLENPSFTLVLTDATATANAGDSYTGANASIFGNVLDAIGMPDSAADEAFVQGAALGGADFTYTGDEPKLIFRDGTTDDWYALNDPDGGNVIALDGTVLSGSDFDSDPTSAVNSFGAVNPSFTGGGGTGPTLTAIYDIQGKAHTSPILGTAVMTSGIVTTVDTNGFYLQDAAGDGDVATSDALFVFTGSAPGVSVGDELNVSGTVSEFTPGGSSSGNLSTTQLSSPSITLQSSGNGLPAATVIGQGGRVPVTGSIDDDAFTSFDPDLDGIDFFESLEGMLVTAQDLLAVSGTNRFGEIFAVVDQGAGATGLSARDTLNIAADDFNPEKIQINADSGILNFAFPQVDTGALLGDVTGVMGYGFGNFEIYPTADFTPQITASGLTAETTTLTGSETQLTVASYNVLNLDPEDTDSDADVADGRFDAIAAQIVANMAAPDIIGLQEVQDNNGTLGGTGTGVTSADVTLQMLVDAITAAGGPTYSFIDNTFIGEDQSGGFPGGNIRTAFLYNDARVDLVAGSVQAVGSQAPGQTFDGARLPLAADFTFNGETVTVVNNHLSSKGGSAPIMGTSQDFGARQEDITVNGSLDERRAQAQEVNDFVDTVLAGDPGAHVVVLGDMNEFEFVSPLRIIEGSQTLDAGDPTKDPITVPEQVLYNLTETLPEVERYSYGFQGNSQSLDHILVSGGLHGGAEFDAVHVNSEFAETASRASDHDPLVARLTIANTAPLNLAGWRQDDTLQGGAGDDTVRLRFGQDTATGNAGADTFIFDARRMQDGDSHVITDLDFSQADRLQFNFYGPTKVFATSDAELLALDIEDWIDVSAAGSGYALTLYNGGDSVSVLV
ncbi:endonuclease/exonuclease/phosphatase family protein [Fluviibacterium sp. S390]|uniref:endonuclease/exonuclease/phosphatase family protein n=1 Tax=Fluviibacterium sp. S390 TaxID=3415139 RepID=UPI003C79FF59